MPNVITRVLTSKRGRGESECQSDATRKTPLATAGFEDGTGPGAKGHGQLLETRKANYIDSPLEPPEGT